MVLPEGVRGDPGLTMGMAAKNDPATGAQKIRTGLFVMEWLNALSAAYYFNYLFFYLERHFGFGNRDNLLITALYGFLYMVTAWYAGQAATKWGQYFALRFGVLGTVLVLAAHGFAPQLFGYSRTTEIIQWLAVAGWTIAVCFTWPVMQGLLSRSQSPRQLGHTAGIYNMIWAGANAVAYLTSGWLMDRFGGEILFWVAAGLNAAQFIMIWPVQTLDHSIAWKSVAPAPEGSTPPPMNPRPIAKARTFLHLARVGNPFAYVAIYGIISVAPKLTEHLGLTPTYAGIIGSVWFWVRLIAFGCFWVWPGWHYKFRWLVAAFIGMIGSFIVILLSANLWMLVVAQVIFGSAVGLIYYSSLFYSMDAGESKGKRGGLHEAAIGLGVFIGPITGVAALQLFPGRPNAGTWGMSALLVLGLLIFLAIQHKARSAMRPARVDSALP